MVDKRNSPLEALSESEAVRTRLSPQFVVSVIWIGYVIVCFSEQSTRSSAVELTYVTNCSL